MSAFAQIDVGSIEYVDQIWWFMSRAAGIVAWVLLSCSVIIGMTMSSRRNQPLPTGWALDLHRFFSMLAIVFLGIHLAALVPDNFVEFGLAELFIPMASTWEPSAVAWGIVAFWLLLAVEITSLLRARLPHRLWRGVHLLSFVVWISGTVHLLFAGTDVGHWSFRIVQVIVIGAVTLLFVARVIEVFRPDGRGSSPVGTLPIEEPIDIDEVDPWEGREFAA